MVTKELGNNKMCLFCASDYHLEMILLPYINKKIHNSKFIIISQTNLEPTMKKLLSRVNISEKNKKIILELNWQEKNLKKIESLICSKICSKEEQEINVIINGQYNYIKNINNYLKNTFNKKLTIIDCFHVSDVNVNIDALRREYKCILNTTKL